jgi:hypothetical protein
VRVDLAPPAEAPVRREPLLAWRAWTLTGRVDGTHLRLRPVAGPRLPWPPRRAARAACKLARVHRSPELDCSCGLHGTREVEPLRKTKNPTVLGTTALWGRVIEHELGYRAEFAYPQRLRLVCTLCFWQRGDDGRDPERVAVIERGRMLPLCAHHLSTAVRYGLRARSLLRAPDVQASLQSTYAVDRLL